jgi:hypothetical protein
MKTRLSVKFSELGFQGALIRFGQETRDGMLKTKPKALHVQVPLVLNILLGENPGRRPHPGSLVSKLGHQLLKRN